MGRQRNMKWAKRRKRFGKASATEKLRLRALFGRHPKFKASLNKAR